MAQLVDQNGIPLSSAGRANVVPFHRDGLANLVSGFGTSIDRASHDFWHFMPMQPEQILAGYRSNWIISKIVDIPAKDMVREWRDWQADESQIEALEAAEIKHGLIAKVQLGLAYGRLGGGVLLLGLGDSDPSRPIPANIGKDALKYVHVFNRWEVSIGPEDRDIASPWFGKPTYFTLRNDAAQVKIHPSRMVVFKGQTVPNMPGAKWEDVFWGDSVVQRIDRAVKNAVRAHDGFARLIDEAKIDVYRLGDFINQLATDEASVRKRIEYTDAGKSSLRGVYLDKEDEFIQRQLSLTGMPEMIEALFSVVAGAADIPATRLLGRAPQGMNATGIGDDKNYQTMIRSDQRLNLSPAIDQIDAVLIPSALGTRPPEIGYSWAPLSVPTEKEQAETFKIMVDAIGIIETNSMAPSAVVQKAFRNFVSDAQLLPGWDKAYDEFEAEEPTIDPNYDPSAIVETQSKGGDRSLSPTAQGQNGSAAPARAAMSDGIAEP